MDVKGAKVLKKRIAITSFSGKYAFLSNFHPSPIVVNGRKYPTVEHAFQAAKTRSVGQKIRIAGLPTPREAKRAGRFVKLRPDWEEIKIEVMHQLLLRKFAPGSELAQKLLDTGDRCLIEGNHHKDDFWGMVQVKRTTPWDGDKAVPCWEGENHLGQLLEKVREELQLHA
jgi:ribA/ribD-fused uncharacterized protein